MTYECFWKLCGLTFPWPPVRIGRRGERFCSDKHFLLHCLDGMNDSNERFKWVMSQNDKDKETILEALLGTGGQETDDGSLIVKVIMKKMGYDV
jgi:hypothetical protein